MSQSAFTSHSVHRATLAVELLALGVLMVPAHVLLRILRDTSVGRHIVSTHRLLLHPDSWVTHVPLMVCSHRWPRYFLRAHMIVIVILRRHIATRAPSIAIRLTVSVGLLLLLLNLILREQHAGGYLFFTACVLHIFQLLVWYLWAHVTLVSRLVHRYLGYVSMRDHTRSLLISDSSVATHCLQTLRGLGRVSRWV